MGGDDDKEDKPIELDDINVNINSSQKQSFAQTFQKVQEEKDRSQERRKKQPLFPKNEENPKKPLRGNPLVFGQRTKPVQADMQRLEDNYILNSFISRVRETHEV